MADFETAFGGPTCAEHDCKFVNDITLHPGYYCTECGEYVLLETEGAPPYVGVCAVCYDVIIDDMISYKEYICD